MDPVAVCLQLLSDLYKLMQIFNIVRSPQFCALLAYKLVNDLGTFLAFDVTAPVKFAVAPLSLNSFELIVASPAAHKFTAIHAL